MKKLLILLKKINNQEEQPDTTDMQELEDEESTAERQHGQGLKIMKSKQMIVRLSILLA